MNRFVRLLPFVLILLVYITALPIDVMDVDSSQYASMSKEMVDNDSYLKITDQGRNYLDKPPLLFWLSALCYKIFGISTWAFKLPSLLFALLGMFSVYRFAKLFYSEQVAYWSAIILGTTQAFFLMVNDVRTDLMLTGAVIFAVWHIAAYIQSKKWVNLISGFIGIGLAMLAKGPIGLVLPVAAIGIDIMLKRDWKSIFKWQWIVGLAITGLVLLPMCIGLYQQYDSNPAVQVNGETGVSGLKFYFWTQSFGRITGENVWNNHPGPFFLTQSTLWAFLPWTVFLLFAFFAGWIKIIREKFKIEQNAEAITLGGFTFALLVLSKSSYQLPHYIFVAYPFAAVFTVNWIINFFSSDKNVFGKNLLKGLQVFIVIIVFAASYALLFYVFKLDNIIVPAVVAIATITVARYLAKNFSKPLSAVQASFVAICIFNLTMNLHFYPHLLLYQAGSVVGKYMNEKIQAENIPQDRFLVFPFGASHSLEFYTGRGVVNIWTESYFSKYKNGDVFYIYTNDEGKERLSKLPYDITQELYTPYFKITELTADFLNPEKRKQTLENNYILKVTVRNQEKADFSPYKAE